MQTLFSYLQCCSCLSSLCIVQLWPKQIGYEPVREGGGQGFARSEVDLYASYFDSDVTSWRLRTGRRSSKQLASGHPVACDDHESDVDSYTVTPSLYRRFPRLSASKHNAHMANLLIDRHQSVLYLRAIQDD